MKPDPSQRSNDPNELASQIVQEATSDKEAPESSTESETSPTDEARD